MLGISKLGSSNAGFSLASVSALVSFRGDSSRATVTGCLPPTVIGRISVGDDCFLADGIYLGVPRLQAGTMALARTRLGHRTFLGNHVVVHSGQRLPDDVLADLDAFLRQVSWPLAVRSSSLLEDSQYQPFTGVYDTFMLPNRHPDHDERLARLVEAVINTIIETTETLLANPADDEAFLRAIAVPKRGLGDASLAVLRELYVWREQTAHQLNRPARVIHQVFAGWPVFGIELLPNLVHLGIRQRLRTE